MTQLRNTTFYVIVGMREESERSKREKEEGRQAAAGTGSEDDASGGLGSDPQSSPHTYYSEWRSEV